MAPEGAAELEDEGEGDDQGDEAEQELGDGAAALVGSQSVR
jgi:hypothetical protein